MEKIKFDLTVLKDGVVDGGFQFSLLRLSFKWNRRLTRFITSERLYQKDPIISSNSSMFPEAEEKQFKSSRL